MIQCGHQCCILSHLFNGIIWSESVNFMQTLVWKRQRNDISMTYISSILYCQPYWMPYWMLYLVSHLGHFRNVHLFWVFFFFLRPFYWLVPYELDATCRPSWLTEFNFVMIIGKTDTHALLKISIAYTTQKSCFEQCSLKIGDNIQDGRLIQDLTSIMAPWMRSINHLGRTFSVNFKLHFSTFVLLIRTF